LRFSLSEDFPNSVDAWNALAWRGVHKVKAVKKHISNMTGTVIAVRMNFCVKMELGEFLSAVV
jgi:hypothetical protein